VTEKNISIRPDPRLGQPGPLAHKIFVAILKKHSNYGRPIRSEVSFTRRELMRLIGRKDWGGSASEQLSRALNEIHYTFIRTHFKGRNGLVEHSFNVFPEVLLERAEAETDPIETCTVTLARPIVASLEDEHFTCLNHALLQQLGTIGQALYMRLFFHFANLYEGQKGKAGLTFQKRYDDICLEWLGGLAIHDRISHVKRDQLGPHLDQLVSAKFLSSYSVDKAKTRTGFVITFRPGPAFFSDYERFYRNRNQGELQWSFDADRREIAEPLKLAYLFAAKLMGQPLTTVPYVSQKETESAKFILEQVAFDDAGNFLDYALAEAKRSKFEVKSLGGLRGYLPGYLAALEQRQASRAAHAKHQARIRQEGEQASYSQYRQQKANALFVTLPESDQEAIEAIARGRCAKPFAGARTGTLSTQIFEMEKARAMAERYPDRLPTFADWKALSSDVIAR
jgi:hypothetical protein